MFRDTGWIRKKSINSDESCKGWKDRKEAVVRHAGGQRQDAVIGNVGVNAQQDVLPSPRGNFGGRSRKPAPIVTPCPQTSSRGIALRRESLVFRGRAALHQEGEGQQPQRRSETPSDVGAWARHTLGIAHGLLHES